VGINAAEGPLPLQCAWAAGALTGGERSRGHGHEAAHTPPLFAHTLAAAWSHLAVRRAPACGVLKAHRLSHLYEFVCLLFRQAPGNLQPGIGRGDCCRRCILWRRWVTRDRRPGWQHALACTMKSSGSRCCALRPALWEMRGHFGPAAGGGTRPAGVRRREDSGNGGDSGHALVYGLLSALTHVYTSHNANFRAECTKRGMSSADCPVKLTRLRPACRVPSVLHGQLSMHGRGAGVPQAASCRTASAMLRLLSTTGAGNKRLKTACLACYYFYFRRSITIDPSLRHIIEVGSPELTSISQGKCPN
jgi:hypothetical protein